MKTIKLEIPEGYQIDSLDKQAGEVRLKQLTDVIDRIKTIEDVLQELGENDADVIVYRKLIATIAATSHTVNYQLAVMIIKAVNEGWTPDWDNSRESKYTLYWLRGSSGFRFYDFDYWSTHSNVGSRFCFKERRLGEYVAKQFVSVFEKFMK